MATCYRHTSRETGVSCANCDRPICPDCMTTTPVGMRCPECSKQKTQVRHVRDSYNARPQVTVVLIALNVLVFFGMSSQSGLGSAGGSLLDSYALIPPEVGSPFNDYYRLVTSGFMHAGILHIGFNMYILWFLGNLLEPSLGPWRFIGLYLAALLAGSLGVVLLDPNSLTVGASGAIFGLMGAAFVMQRARGMDPMQSGIGPMILLNLALGFIIPNVSVAGHVGGLVGGAVAGFLVDRADGLRRGIAPALAACLLVGGLAFGGAIALA
ncbi:MAG: rhomboid family intramembrane serine protease [Solirubrobacteraceae bacterium]